MYPRPDVHFLMPANRGALQSAPEKPITNPPCSKLVFLYCSKGREGTGLDDFHKLLEVSKPKNVKKN